MKLSIEGWRGIGHSYALVNQFQIKHWLNSKNISIYHKDAKLFSEFWAKESSAGLSLTDQNNINNLKDSDNYQYLYRIYAPLNLNLEKIIPTIIFAVTEMGYSAEDISKNDIENFNDSNAKIHTPSNWSKNRLIENGLLEKSILTIPHSVDEEYFYKFDGEKIRSYRNDLGFHENDIIILNVGSFLWNKGIDVLIKAFILAFNKNNNLKLILKEQKSLYPIDSIPLIKKIFDENNINDEKIINSIRIIPNQLSLSDLNILYNISDLYATPYRAEGFNLPALEAQFVGTRVLATKDGATEDFLSKKLNYLIDGNFIKNKNLTGSKLLTYIEPNIEQIISVFEKLERKKFELNPVEILSWQEVCNQICNEFKKL